MGSGCKTISIHACFATKQLSDSCQESWNGMINTSCTLIIEHSIIPGCSMGNRSFSAQRCIAGSTLHSVQPSQCPPACVRLTPMLGSDCFFSSSNWCQSESKKRPCFNSIALNAPQLEFVPNTSLKKLLAECPQSAPQYVLIKRSHLWQSNSYEHYIISDVICNVSWKSNFFLHLPLASFYPPSFKRAQDYKWQSNVQRHQLLMSKQVRKLICMFKQRNYITEFRGHALYQYKSSIQLFTLRDSLSCECPNK